MSRSDRSRSPTLRRSGSALSHADLPSFPRWRGPMGSAVRASQTMSNPQTCRPWPDYLSQSKSGPYQTTQPQMHVRPMLHATLPQPHPFPPTPPMFRPPMFPPASQPSHCSPTQPCPPTPPHNISPSRTPMGSPAGSALGSHSTPQSSTDARIYDFHLNEHWQPDKDYYDNQKINGLTLPRTIRLSAFTKKLDIEGCDPLSLPLVALLYQQANNHWIRKLASGREMYLIPTGDIASVVFMTELLKQLLTRASTLTGWR